VALVARVARVAGVIRMPVLGDGGVVVVVVVVLVMIGHVIANHIPPGGISSVFRHTRGMSSAALCPCGGGRAFDGCCGPVLAGEPAPTAEALMRSRYTAFARGDAAHVRDTWHPGTRPDDVDLDDGTRWMRLEVLGTDRGGEGDTRGWVEFRAHWRAGGRAGVLHERSRFVRQSGRWWYLDGVVDPE
jgi:SEC-C motif domain protein